AVHGLPYLVITAKREAHAVHAGPRDQGAQYLAADHLDVDAARANLRQHVGIVAELRIRKHLYLDGAVSLLGDALSSSYRVDHDRMRDREAGRPAQAKFWCAMRDRRYHNRRRRSGSTN